MQKHGLALRSVLKLIQVSMATKAHVGLFLVITHEWINQQPVPGTEFHTKGLGI